MQISPAQLSQLTQSVNSSELNSLSGADSSTDPSSSFENILEQMLTDMATQSSSTAKSTGAINPVTGAQSSPVNDLKSTQQLQAQNAMQMLEALNSQSLMQNTMISSDDTSSDTSTDSSGNSGII